MSEKKIAHMVYFTLQDPTEQNIDAQLAEMREYLDQHPGLEYFSCGVLNQDLARPVNDRAFHVSLHTVFTNRAAHDAYQVHPRHLQFIERNKPCWKQVRVFDSDC
jgi:Stress responsive A/B Barrel Domain